MNLICDPNSNEMTENILKNIFTYLRNLFQADLYALFREYSNKFKVSVIQQEYLNLSYVANTLNLNRSKLFKMYFYFIY